MKRILAPLGAALGALALVAAVSVHTLDSRVPAVPVHPLVAVNKPADSGIGCC
jgi:hypothetical protein